MFQLAAAVVYTDTVRHTPGRPEFVDAESSTRLWLLPKKQMDEVHYARAHTHFGPSELHELNLRTATPWLLGDHPRKRILKNGAQGVFHAVAGSAWRALPARRDVAVTP